MKWLPSVAIETTICCQGYVMYLPDQAQWEIVTPGFLPSEQEWSGILECQNSVSKQVSACFLKWTQAQSIEISYWQNEIVGVNARPERRAAWKVPGEFQWHSKVLH